MTCYDDIKAAMLVRGSYSYKLRSRINVRYVYRIL